MGEPVGISAYARTRGLSRQAVRRMIRDRGAPCVRRGGPGPGRETLVDAEQLDAWRGVSAAPAPALLDPIAEALLDTLIRNGARDEPICFSLKIPRREAAALLVASFERIARRVLGRAVEDDEQPEQIVRLRTIVQSG
jgi:hypothetical protein